MKLTTDLEGNVMLLCRPLVAGGSPSINKLTTLLLTAMLLAPLAVKRVSPTYQHIFEF